MRQEANINFDLDYLNGQYNLFDLTGDEQYFEGLVNIKGLVIAFPATRTDPSSLEIDDITITWDGVDIDPEWFDVFGIWEYMEDLLVADAVDTCRNSAYYW